MACWMFALTRLSFFAGPYIRSRAPVNEVKSPCVRRPDAICPLPYQSAAAMPTPPSTSMSGGRLESAAVTFMFVRNRWWPARLNFSTSVASVPNAFTMRWPVNASAADVGDLLERFLAPPRRAANALSEPDERVDDEWCSGQTDDGQSGVQIEEQRRIPDERQRLSRQIADGFRDDLLDLVDVVCDPRHQLAGRVPGEEAGRLTQDVLVERIAHVHDDPLPDIGHQIRRDVRPDTLQEVQRDDRPRDEAQALLVPEHVVEDGLDYPGQAGGPRRVDQHTGDRPGKADGGTAPSSETDVVADGGRSRMRRRPIAGRMRLSHCHAVRTIVSRSAKAGVQSSCVRALSGAA